MGLKHFSKLPPLYAQGANGVLMTVFEIHVDSYRTITGLKDGARTASGWVKCLPTNVGRSNARTASEQAIFEATAKWKKKQEQEGYHLEESRIDQGAGFIEPMLAYPLEGRKLPKSIMLDRKYNGMRMITNEFGGKSRKGKPIVTAPHIIEALEDLFADYPDLVLDGELYNHEYRFKLNELLSIVKKSKPLPTDLALSKKIVKYYVYDAYGFNSVTESTGNFRRRKELQVLLKGYSEYIVPVEFFQPADEVEMKELYNGFVADGYEGAIIRNADAPYQHKRTNDLLKLKPEDDSEGKILGVYQGNGAWVGCAKTATLLWNKKEFDATFKCSMDIAKQIWKDQDKWVGKTVTFKYNGLTGKGTPNFAQIDPNNCKVAH